MRDKGQEARDKLMPCPFCGGEAHTHYVEGYELWEVSCGQCAVEISAYLSEVDAIEAWNRRAERTAKVETYTDDQQETWSVCECGTDVLKIFNYCPECGAKLDWGE